MPALPAMSRIEVASKPPLAKRRAEHDSGCAGDMPHPSSKPGTKRLCGPLPGASLGAMSYVFALGNPATNANPFPEFARLRAEDPVHWSPVMKAWIVTRYADVKQVALNNRQISADRLTPFFKTNPEYQRGSIESLVRYLNHWMVFRDPPDHTRLRRLFTKAFTPTAVANLRPNIEDIVAHLIDGMQAKARRGATVDYVADFAYPLPASGTMALLAVPRADLERVKVWSDDIALFIGTAQVAGNKYLRAEAGAKAMS